MKPLRILQFGPLPPPVGGMATVIQDLAKEQASRLDVRVINNAKTTAEDRTLLQGISAQLKLLSKLMATCLSWRPDVVHIHTCSQFTFWRNSIDVLLSRLCGRKVVLHIHGARFHLFLDSLSRLQASAARFVFHRCHGVVVLGEEWARVLEPWAEAKRVVIIANGVPIPEPIQRNKKDHIEVICLANYAERKGQADLIQAVITLKSSQPVHLKLFGFTEEADYKATINAQLSQYDGRNKVFIGEPITGEEKQACLQGADIFCLPSYDEGLPMSMLEAMACSIPVIVTKVGAIPEVIHHEKDGLLIDAGDIDALRDSLHKLINDRSNATTIGATGRELVTQGYSVARVADQLDELYANILK